MLYLDILLPLLFVQLVHAYSVRRDPQVTPCILKCLTISLPAGCSDTTNISCLCNNPTFQSVLKTCIQQSCPQEEATFETFQTFQCSAYTTTNASHSTGVTATSGSGTATQPSDMSAQLAQLTNQASGHSDASTIRIAAIVGGVLGVVLLFALATFAMWWFREGRHPPPSRLNRVRDATVSRDEQARTYRGAEAIAIPWTPEPALSTPLLPPSAAGDSKLPIAQIYSSRRSAETSPRLGMSSSSPSSSPEPTSSGVTGSVLSEPVDERRNSRSLFRLSLGLGLPPRYEPRRISRQFY